MFHIARLSKHLLTLVAGLFTLAVAVPAFAQAGGSGGGGSIVIASLSNPSGGIGHSVEVTNIKVSDDGKTSTVTIRDPECPTKTSTMTVDIASGKITDHTGEPCHSYKGWKVRGLLKIKKKKPADTTSTIVGKSDG